MEPPLGASGNCKIAVVRYDNSDIAVSAYTKMTMVSHRLHLVDVVVVVVVVVVVGVVGGGGVVDAVGAAAQGRRGYSMAVS